MALILVSVQVDTCGTQMPYPHLSSYYCQAFAATGLVPMLASCADAASQAASADALLLTGGGDLCPAYYSYHVPQDHISLAGQARDAYEVALLRAFLALDKPVFGICRGMQLINVILGGTLWEDLPYELANASHTDGRIHEIEVVKDSWLSFLFGKRVMVNSYHHQACRTLAPGLRLSASAPDGIPEAFCHEYLPVYGVQWHPERMYVPGERDDSNMKKLFTHWQEQVKNRKKKINTLKFLQDFCFTKKETYDIL